MRSNVRHGTDLNPTAAALLGLLMDRPMTGWDLVAAAERRVGAFWTITRSQVYRELAGMETAALVVAGPVESRDRKPYDLTDRGRELFAEWVAADPGPDQVRIPLLLTLSFARHLAPDRVRTLLLDARHEHAARLAEYEGHRRSIHDAGSADASVVGPEDRFRAATLGFGLHHERAVVAWLDELLDGHDLLTED